MSHDTLTRRETTRATFELHMQTVPLGNEHASQPQQRHAIEATADGGSAHKRGRSVSRDVDISPRSEP